MTRVNDQVTKAKTETAKPTQHLASCRYTLSARRKSYTENLVSGRQSGFPNRDLCAAHHPSLIIDLLGSEPLRYFRDAYGIVKYSIRGLLNQRNSLIGDTVT